ncbi:MAG: TIGR01212 family radical SAM protein, partial [Treponema sp.]|nr:TIGR01212 family radical SAM protein [Treponema sp.]
PTRDGTKGFGGCIFCSPNGSGDFVPSKLKSISEQIEDAKKIIEKKYKVKDKKYIAYFQNFTNTYGNPDVLYSKYLEAINCKDIIGISIATRPDCVNDEILKKINMLTEHTFVIIELGFQSSNEKTIKYINRAYSNDEYLDCVLRIKKINKEIHIVTHLIIGLPGETENDIINSTQYVINCGTDGLKFTVLYILRGTGIENDYLSGKFDTLSMEEYFSIIKKIMSIVPNNIVIHRLTGDGPKKILIAPEWTKDKKKVLNYMNSL